MAIVLKRRPEAGQRFPFISLPKAIERARELYKVASGHEMPFGTAVGAWGYAEKSSGGSQTAAALKAFGLLEDVGGSEVRKVKLTDAALRIIRDPRDISPDRDALIREAAMRPALHRDVYGKYQGMPPSDEALKAYLLIDRGLKDDAVPEFMREFTATMAYAKVPDSATIQDMEHPPHAGQNEFVDAAAPGPVHRGEGTAFKFRMPARLEGAAPPPPPNGMRREVFALDEGDVILTFPDNLSSESYQDLQDHLELFLRKAKRRAATTKTAASEAPAGPPASTLDYDPIND